MTVGSRARPPGRRGSAVPPERAGGASHGGAISSAWFDVPCFFAPCFAALVLLSCHSAGDPAIASSPESAGERAGGTEPAERTGVAESAAPGEAGSTEPAERTGVAESAAPGEAGSAEPAERTGVAESAAPGEGAGSAASGPTRPELAAPRPALPLCRDRPSLIAQQAFDGGNEGCRVQLGEWAALIERARSEPRIGIGPECEPGQQERCRAACEDEDVRACIKLVHARLRGVAIDLREAFHVVARACVAEDGEACHALGNIWRHGLAGVPEDRSHAFLIRERACRLGQGAACAMLGYMHLNGEDGIEQNADTGFKLLRQGCHMGALSACNDLGWAFVSDRWGKEPDPDRAVRLFVWACRRGAVVACGSLGEAFEKGWGVPQDDSLAEAFWSIECDHWPRDEACSAVNRLRE